MYKKISIGIVVASVMLTFVGLSISEGRVNNNDTVVSLSQQNDNVASKLLLPSLGVATSTILVDISGASTTAFTHIATAGRIEVSQIHIDWSANALATTTLKFGLVASSTHGVVSDVYWFDEVSFSTFNPSGLNGRQSVILDYGLSAIRLDVANGRPASFLTNDTLINTTNYATSTKISSPYGLQTSGLGSFPGVGDLVMQVHQQLGTATTSVTTIYRTK